MSAITDFAGRPLRPNAKVTTLCIGCFRELAYNTVGEIRHWNGAGVALTLRLIAATSTEPAAMPPTEFVSGITRQVERVDQRVTAGRPAGYGW